MLTEETKQEWEDYFRKEAETINIPPDRIEGFISAAMYGIKKYSLSLTKTISNYATQLQSTDKDGDTWITDGTALMFIQHVKPK